MEYFCSTSIHNVDLIYCFCIQAPQVSRIEGQSLYQKLMVANQKLAQYTRERQALVNHVEELTARLEKKELLLREDRV